MEESENSQQLIQLKTSEHSLVIEQLTPSNSEEFYSFIHANYDHLKGDELPQRFNSLEETQKILAKEQEKGALRFAVRDPETKAFMGAVTIKDSAKRSANAEISYFLGKDFVGKGFAKDAITAVTQYAMENGYRELFAQIDRDNRRSQKTIMSSGYKPYMQFDGAIYFNFKK